MAREFTMGARINMSDGFSSPVSRMTQTTRQFGEAARSGSHAVDGMGRSAMASTAGLGAFTAGSRAANLSARGLAGGVATLTASMLGLNSIMGAVMGLLTFKFAYDWLIKSNSEMEQYKNTLTVVLKSSERATEMLEWASKFARDTPFEVPQIVEATTRLETYGITAQKTLGNIGDMASVMGKPLMQAVEAVADAQTGEVERLKEFGITKDMLIAQGQKMGTSVANDQGQITDMQAFNAALFTLMEERYKGGMAMQAKSFKGMLGSVADFIGEMGGEFGKPIFERMKVGLAGALGFLDRIKADGTMGVITAKAQTFGLAVTDVFGAAFGLISRVVTQLSTKIGVFLDNNAPRFALIGGLLGEAFTTLQAYAMPILNWLIDTALPNLVDGLLQVHTWQLQIAEFFITHWSNIAPFIEGIAIAIGMIYGPIVAVLGVLYVLSQVATTWVAITRAWAAAQAILNAVMLLNPMYLVIVGIGLLIGAGIWLVQNWEMVSDWFMAFWPALLAAALGPLGMLVRYVYSHFEEIKTYIVGLADQAYTWGANIIDTMITGVLSAKDRLIGAFTEVFTAARQLMPFSDAKEGPFSQLTYSGGAIMSTMAEGVMAGASLLHGAMDDAFSDAPSMGAGSVSLTAAGAVNSIPISASRTGSVSNSQPISISFGSININGAGKDMTQMADEFISILHEKLSSAGDIRTGGMAELL